MSRASCSRNAPLAEPAWRYVPEPDRAAIFTRSAAAVAALPPSPARFAI
jgi:hypothetical protein